MTKSTFSWAEPPVSPSQSRDFAREWMTQEETSRLPILQSLTNIAPDGWFGRTSPASCPATEDGILVPSSGRWANSGMGSPIECLTLTTLVAPSRARASSLSDILETGAARQQYCLSEKLLKLAQKEAQAGRAHIHCQLKTLEAGTRAETLSATAACGAACPRAKQKGL